MLFTLYYFLCIKMVLLTRRASKAEPSQHSIFFILGLIYTTYCQTRPSALFKTYSCFIESVESLLGTSIQILDLSITPGDLGSNSDLFSSQLTVLEGHMSRMRKSGWGQLFDNEQVE